LALVDGSEGYEEAFAGLGLRQDVGGDAEAACVGESAEYAIIHDLAKDTLLTNVDIGVSNFGIKNLEKLLNDPSCKTTPAVDQIELHPNCPSPKLLDYCKSKGIHATAYSCLGSTNSPLAKDQTLKKIADSKGLTTAQVL
jgi:diketogulonate reductase-like aldo/keto reductase